MLQLNMKTIRQPEVNATLTNFIRFIFRCNFFIYLAELKMDVLRERECKDSMERQLSDERKLRGKFEVPSF